MSDIPSSGKAYGTSLFRRIYLAMGLIRHSASSPLPHFYASNIVHMVLHVPYRAGNAKRETWERERGSWFHGWTKIELEIIFYILYIESIIWPKINKIKLHEIYVNYYMYYGENQIMKWKLSRCVRTLQQFFFIKIDLIIIRLITEFRISLEYHRYSIIRVIWRVMKVDWI